MLRGCRTSRSPRRFSGRAFHDSVSCSRRSSSGGVSRPWPRNKRTSKPPRTPLLHTFRKLPWRALIRRASFPMRGALGGNPHIQRLPRLVFVRRKPCRARPRPARACASSPLRAPCVGGSRDRVRHNECPLIWLWRIGRARRHGLFRGRSRRGYDQAREGVGRTSDKPHARGSIPFSACGVHARTGVLLPGFCAAWFPPGAGEGVRTARRLVRLIPG